MKRCFLFACIWIASASVFGAHSGSFNEDGKFSHTLQTLTKDLYKDLKNLQPVVQELQENPSAFLVKARGFVKAVHEGKTHGISPKEHTEILYHHASEAAMLYRCLCGFVTSEMVERLRMQVAEAIATSGKEELHIANIGAGYFYTEALVLLTLSELAQKGVPLPKKLGIHLIDPLYQDSSSLSHYRFKRHKFTEAQFCFTVWQKLADTLLGTHCKVELYKHQAVQKISPRYPHPFDIVYSIDQEVFDPLVDMDVLLYNKMLTPEAKVFCVDRLAYAFHCMAERSLSASTEASKQALAKATEFAEAREANSRYNKVFRRTSIPLESVYKSLNEAREWQIGF